MTVACESPGSGQECRATRRCSFTQTQRTVTHHETWDTAAPDPARHRPRRAAAMSNVRPFWIAWCCCWAAFWLIIGFFTFGLGWIGVPLSLLAILIPIGPPAQPTPPLPYYPPAPQ